MVSRQLRGLLLFCLALAAFACAKDGEPRTELMLVADTDVRDLDTIRFEIEDGDRRESEEDVPRADGAPLTLGVLREKGSLGPVVVSAQGIRAGATVVERRAEVSFVPGKTLVVELHLVQSCVARRCFFFSQTCTERGCESASLDPEELASWSGSVPELDASTAAADGGADGGSADDAGGGGVDGGSLVTCGVDPDVDLSSDVSHCGSCGNACTTSARNSVPTCVAGVCGAECRVLYGDCDGNANNGCEQSLSITTNCGMCGLRCDPGSSCLLGTCR